MKGPQRVETQISEEKHCLVGAGVSEGAWRGWLWEVESWTQLLLDWTALEWGRRHAEWLGQAKEANRKLNRKEHVPSFCSCHEVSPYGPCCQIPKEIQLEKENCGVQNPSPVSQSQLEGGLEAEGHYLNNWHSLSFWLLRFTGMLLLSIFELPYNNRMNSMFPPSYKTILIPSPKWGDTSPNTAAIVFICGR